MKGVRPFSTLAVFGLCAMYASGICAEETKYSLGGYYKNFFTVLRYPDVIGGTVYPITNPDVSMDNTFRLNLDVIPSEKWKVNVAYALSPTIQANATGLPSVAFYSSTTGTYRAVDIPTRLFSVKNQSQNRFAMMQNLDRANVTLSTSDIDLTVGRQSIAFGSSRVINPTDILSPFEFSVFDKEERVGIDAVRLSVATAQMGELDFGYVLGHDIKFDNSAMFIRSKFNTWDTDISFMMMDFRNNLMLGADVARNLSGATMWLEMAYVFANIMKNYNSSQNYFRLSTGVDYNLTSKLYSYIEYHYNSAGKAGAAAYSSLSNTAAYSDGFAYLLGRHYLIPGITYEMTALTKLSSQLLINMNDPSMFMSLVLSYNFLENVMLDFGTYISLGRNMTMQTLSNYVPRSEFGMYPSIFYTSIRLYF